jgi:hypothetical protein
MPSATDIQTRLTAYREAELRILKSQEYVLSDGGVTHRNRRAELEQVRLAIKDLEVQLEKAQAAEAGRRRVVFIRPGA